jgi:hypothetical protein
MKLMQGKPLHVRQRIAAIATGSVGLVLILVFIYAYMHPIRPKWDPEYTITSAYTTVLGKVQSLFHRK